jgi:hypothetical protein
MGDMQGARPVTGGVPYAECQQRQERMGGRGFDQQGVTINEVSLD